MSAREPAGSSSRPWSPGASPVSRLETVLGWVEFAGRRLVVAPGVFVPRRRTELLARVAASYAGPRSILLELCCGVAPVAAVVAAGEVHASDVDPVALGCARRNVPHGHVHLSDLYDALPGVLRGRVDVLVANAPYVPTDRIALMPPEARDHEPTAGAGRRPRRRGPPPEDRRRCAGLAGARGSAAGRDQRGPGRPDHGAMRDAGLRPARRARRRPRGVRRRGRQTGGAGVTIPSAMSAASISSREMPSR